MAFWFSIGCFLNNSLSCKSFFLAALCSFLLNLPIEVFSLPFLTTSTCLNICSPTFIPPFALANAVGIDVASNSLDCSTVSLFLLFNTSAITLSGIPISLPLITTCSGDIPCLNAASGFFNCFCWTSVNSISLPLKISAKAVPINVFKVMSWISFSDKSLDILNWFWIYFHIPSNHSLNLDFKVAFAMVSPLLPIRIAIVSSTALFSLPSNFFNWRLYSSVFLTNVAPRLYIFLPCSVVWI